MTFLKESAHLGFLINKSKDEFCEEKDLLTVQKDLLHFHR